MSSNHDTFNSKKTTPFERRGVPRDPHDPRKTTPFDRDGVGREAALDRRASSSDDANQELGTEARPTRWLFVLACVSATVGAVIWSTGGF